MLDITILAVGKIKSKFLAEAESEYLKRLKPFARVNILETKAESFSSSTKEKAKQTETERLAKILKDTPGGIYLLSESGNQYDSISFASNIHNHDGKKITLVIAGSLGFDKEIVDSYPSISLSSLTFTHEMARVILLEQIYRAISIERGKDYHY